MSARGADGVEMGDEVAQRGASDAESVVGDELREPRRRNSSSDLTSREIEEHVLTGHASVRSWCAACVQGRGRAERHQGEGRKVLEDGSKVQSSLRIIASLGIESVKLKWNSVETVQSW